MAQSQSPTIRSLPSSYSTHGGEDLTISHRYLSIELLPGPVFFPPSDRVNTVGSTVIDSSSSPYSRPASPLFTQKTIPDIPSQICNDCGSHSLRCTRLLQQASLEPVTSRALLFSLRRSEWSRRDLDYRGIDEQFQRAPPCRIGVLLGYAVEF
ncbi:hypothetical protein BS47DRAFT_1487472 [Hydnum rufescens UP504]|uniref:Uncharacterized protein n=1 Tax=Hydnum rufescens UP504 TaxID=1448309 RepID=A0A9P6AT98_9AGAM|nr:hypothetical protein BS47DRAFT_1487472 [Hydnum rufescens UP504]